MTRIRKREFNSGNTVIGTYRDWTQDGSPTYQVDYRPLSSEVNEVHDENHGFNWRSKGGNQGSGFYKWNITTSRSPSEKALLYRPNGLGSNRGIMYDGAITVPLEPVPPFQDAQAWAEGDSAGLYFKARPDKPIMNGFAALYEAIKDTPELLHQRFTTNYLGNSIGSSAKKANVGVKDSLNHISNYWLAEQFGWKPLLQDTCDFIKLHFTLKGYLDQLLRDNGKPVRRMSRIPAVNIDYGISQFTQYSAVEQSFVTQAYASEPIGTYHWTSGADVWCKGTFRYWLPSGPQDWRWTADMVARINGLYPSPQQVYKLVPWSWLTDWFSSAGSVVDNMFGSIADRSANDWCFTMARAWQQRDARVNASFYSTNSFDGPTIDLTATSSIRTETKFRMPATPFGFGIKQEDLSPMQLSILAALGIARL